MKSAQFVLVAVAAPLWMALATAAEAQLHQPHAVRPTAFDYGEYYRQDPDVGVPSPSDLPVEEPPSAQPQAQPDSAGCTSCGDGGCRSGCRGGRRRCRSLCCCECQPWQLFGGWNHRKPLGLTVDGWIDFGITANDDDPASNFNGPVTFNDREGEAQLNQLYLVMQRELDTRGGWGWGGRVDVLYGTDSRFTEARGLETDGNFNPKWNNEEFYGLALPQLYLEAGYGDLSLKLGHFYTIVGYESVMSTSNFFYSHAYTMQYGEPFTHTGLLADLLVARNTNVLFGFDRGWDNWEDDQGDNLSFLGGITWENDRGLSVAWTLTAGEEPTFRDATINDDRFFYSLVVSKEFGDRFTYVVQHDYGRQNTSVSITEDAEWYGLNQYWFYELNRDWTAGFRFEWFRDDDGTRVAGIGGRNNGHPLGAAQFQGNFYAATIGLNWSPNPNLVVRPEVRFDWFDGNATGAAGPFDDGNDTDQILFGIDAIVRY